MVTEIFTKDITHPRVTVTPTRLTIKIPKGFSKEDADKVIDRGYAIQKELGVVTKSWRGTLNLNSSSIRMMDGHGSPSKRQKKYIKFGDAVSA